MSSSDPASGEDDKYAGFEFVRSRLRALGSSARTQPAGIGLVLLGFIALVGFVFFYAKEYGTFGDCCLAFRPPSPPGIHYDIDVPITFPFYIAWKGTVVGALLMVWGGAILRTGRLRSLTARNASYALVPVVLVHVVMLSTSWVAKDVSESVGSPVLAILVFPLEFGKRLLFAGELFGGAAVSAVLIAIAAVARFRGVAGWQGVIAVGLPVLSIMAGLSAPAYGSFMTGMLKFLFYSALLAIGPTIVGLYAAAPAE